MKICTRLVSLGFSSLTGNSDLEDIEAFFSDKNTGTYNLVLEQSKDSIRAAVGWLERDREDVSTVRRRGPDVHCADKSSGTVASRKPISFLVECMYLA